MQMGTMASFMEVGARRVAGGCLPGSDFIKNAEERPLRDALRRIKHLSHVVCQTGNRPDMTVGIR